ncbi:RNA pseudouridine synthase [Sphingobium aquiterrae]|uniref:RluA family pseudouridine synthase n=1 Tax=Sphingobium aquiterrae TaxID=2038656 RepID=UPI0030161C0A
MALLSERVLFIDGEAIIIDKPAGLPVDPPRDGALSLENHLDALAFGFKRWPLAVHRLDRDTSGCLLLARNPKAHKRFAAAFEAGTVEKVYVAVLTGVPQAQGGTVDLPLHKVSSAEQGWRMVPDVKKGKPASTRWQVLAERDGRALVAFMPATGRTHQIRVHALEGLGFPIAGDPVYGDGEGPMLLHALSLSIARDGKPPVAATAPLPDSFTSAGFTADDLAALGEATV